LLGSCVHHLVDGEDFNVSSLRKKKKAKILDDGDVKETGSLSIKGWHLRTLVLSSLHKCFLYDTGSLKFLESSNFQASIFLHFSQYEVVMKEFKKIFFHLIVK
jgi:U3 small nucleolar RNA-associated protein 10